MQAPSADVRDPETYSIIGAAMAVHSEMGCGFLEAVYQQAMGWELVDREILHRPQVDLKIYYKGRLLECSYRADSVCCEGIIVEIKAIKAITAVERAQVLNYLKATGYRRALLINFGAESLEFERIVR